MHGNGLVRSLDIWFVWQRKGDRLRESRLNSPFVYVIQRRLASVVSPKDKGALYCTAAQILYLCLSGTQTIENSLSVAGLLKPFSSDDLSYASNFLPVFFLCPTSCFTNDFGSVQPNPSYLVYLFYFLNLPVPCNSSLLHPKKLKGFKCQICLSLQRTPFISPLQPRLPLRGEPSTAQLWIRKGVSKKHNQVKSIMNPCNTSYINTADGFMRSYCTVMKKALRTMRYASACSWEEPHKPTGWGIPW